MENKSVQRKSSADARIVQAVRRLKSTRQKENLVEVRKNQEEQKNQKLILRKSININNNNQENNSNKNASTILHPIISKKNSFIINNSNDNLININEHNNIINNHRRINQSNTLILRKNINISKNNHSNKRISIDGGLGKPGTSSTNKSQNKTFDYEILKKYKKKNYPNIKRIYYQKKIWINIKKNLLA